MRGTATGNVIPWAGKKCLMGTYITSAGIYTVSWEEYTKAHGIGVSREGIWAAVVGGRLFHISLL